MKRMKRHGVLVTIIIGVVITVLLYPIIFINYVVDGESMEPTLHDGNKLMVNKVIYDLQEVDRFDVIVFHVNKNEDFVKRVIGLPEDELEYKNDRLYVNGKYIEEEYLEPYKKEHGDAFYTEDFDLQEVTGTKKVPENSLFVMGDNRNNSLDSRSFGFIEIDQIVGKVDLKYWPLEEEQLVTVP